MSFIKRKYISVTLNPGHLNVIDTSSNGERNELFNRKRTIIEYLAETEGGR